MDDQGWFEVRIVLRTSSDLIDQAQAWLEDMGLAEVRRVDVIALDDDLRRWDGGRPPGVLAPPDEELPDVADHVPSLMHLGMPDPAPSNHPVFDGLRRGLHLHEQ